MVAGFASCHRPAGRLLALLVLTVLAGVLGMHGLGPQGAVSPAPPQPAHAMALAHPASVHDAGEPCSHPGGGGRHPAHADATCAAAGTVSPYAPPPLSGALPGAPASAASVTHVPGRVDSDRAPPDLSELQLLRI